MNIENCECGNIPILTERKQSNGRPYWVYQCLHCGKKASSGMKRPEYAVPLFNEELYDGYYKKREQRDIDRQNEYIRSKEQQRAEWFEKYSDYLSSYEWRNKRERVLRRDQKLCQACLQNEATEVHHLTYKHVGNEPLFDLVSICYQCHEKITEIDRKAR